MLCVLDSQSMGLLHGWAHNLLITMGLQISYNRQFLRMRIKARKVTNQANRTILLLGRLSLLTFRQFSALQHLTPFFPTFLLFIVFLQWVYNDYLQHFFVWVGPFRIIPDIQGSHLGNGGFRLWDLQQMPSVARWRCLLRHYRGTL